MPGEFESFGPKILVVGRYDRTRTLFVHTVLEDVQDRFDVISAGIEPAQDRDDQARTFLRQEGYEPPDTDPQSIGASLNDHLQLVAYVTDAVRTEGPIVATPGEKITLDLDRPEGTGGYRELLDRVHDRSIPRILEELPGEMTA